VLDRKPTIDLILGIIRTELDLNENQIVIYNQKALIPPASVGLWVAVQYVFGKPFSNRIEHASSGTDEDPKLESTQDYSVEEHYNVLVLSYDESALARKEEVQMALQSDYAQQVQEANSFSLSKIGDIQDVSEVEASARLFRFDIPVVALAWYQKKKKVDFFDNYQGTIQTEQAALEFTQKTEE